MSRISLIYYGVVRAKKNSKQIVKDPTGRPRIISNQAAREMERDMQEQFGLQLLKLGKSAEVNRSQVERILEAKDQHITYEVNIEIWNPNKVRRDLDNQLTSILDGLVRAGALPDDCASILTKVSASYAGIDRKFPRAEIEIISKGGERA